MSFARVHVFVEGHTEEAFVKRVMAPHLGARGTELVCSILRTSRHQHGGLVSYGQFADQVRRLLLRDRHVHVTTMIDYYGLPRDFPGWKPASAEPSTASRAELIERAMAEEIGKLVPPEAHGRFIPHVSMHEFEGLLFSGTDRITEVLLDDGPLPRLREIRRSFLTPEDIDDGPMTAPSKRLQAHFPRYKKRIDGPSIAELIGLPTIRRECPLFDAWLSRLEALEPLEP